MSISDAIAPHIPFLRRFARALCGTQAAGDAYVAATLEAILADPVVSTPTSNPKSPYTSCSCAAGATYPSTLMSILPLSAMKAARAGILPPSHSSRAWPSC